jgi:hypothetical protein
MTLGRTFAILVFSTFFGTSAALAGGIHNSASAKGDRVSAKTGPATLRYVKPPAVKPPAPIVMGRSVGAHRKTKLHHVKVKEAGENPGTVDKPR